MRKQFPLLGTLEVSEIPCLTNMDARLTKEFGEPNVLNIDPFVEVYQSKKRTVVREDERYYEVKALVHA